MPFDAKIFKVFIASPNDVEEERIIIRDSISEWNAINSINKKIILLPIGWETNTTPEMGERPQSIVNRQTLKDCDLLVGVFWTRIGSNTGKYISGTVEEIEEHMKTRKPTMLYFSNVKINPQEIDMDQYSKLSLFKDDCQKKGLCGYFNDKSEFKNKFSRELQIKINSDKYFAIDLNTMSEQNSIKPGAIGEADLSNEAKILIKAASSDTRGIIIIQSISQGIRIRSSKLDQVADNIRERAKWEGAIKELVNEKFIDQVDTKGRFFKINRKGFDLADSL